MVTPAKKLEEILPRLQGKYPDSSNDCCDAEGEFDLCADPKR